jgi:hypothetical protein
MSPIAKLQKQTVITIKSEERIQILSPSSYKICKFRQTVFLEVTFTSTYSSRGESVCFAYATSLQAEGKQTQILCKPKTLPT